MKKVHLSFVLAGMLVAGFIGAGFQAQADKLGTVDLNRLIQESNYGVARMKELNNQLAARKALMDFLTLYRVATVEEAQKMRALWLKATVTEAEKAELDKLKTKIMDSDKKFNELRQRQNLTDADRELLRDYSMRTQAVEETLTRWNQEFQDELGASQDEARRETLKRAKAALAEIGKAKAFTVIFESTVAPYSANDLTEDALKAMNAKG